MLETPDPIELQPELAREVQDLGLGFLASFLETALGRRPDLPEALAELGHVYTLQGRHLEGLEVDRKLVEHFPDSPTVHYNLACSMALLGREGEALDALENAIALGYDDAAFMRQDADLASLRVTSRFDEILRRLESLLT